MRKILVGFGLLFNIAGFSAPSGGSAPSVFVQPIKDALLSDTLSYPAKVVPKINASLLAESDGVVSKVYFSLGQKVTRNKRVLTIKHTDPVYQYAPVSVRAPVTGVVSSLDVTEGSRVTKGQKLATITDPSQIVVTVELAASDLLLVRAGQVGELQLSSRDKTFPVKVLGVSPFVEPATGTAASELIITEKGDLPLAPGQVGRVTFRVNEHKGFEIPEMAVIYKGRDTFLRVVEENRAKLIPVTLGPMRRGLVEVLKGIKGGEQLIVRSNVFVADGEEVNIQTEESAKFE